MVHRVKEINYVYVQESRFRGNQAGGVWRWKLTSFDLWVWKYFVYVFLRFFPPASLRRGIQLQRNLTVLRHLDTARFLEVLSIVYSETSVNIYQHTPCRNPE